MPDKPNSVPESAWWSASDQEWELGEKYGDTPKGQWRWWYPDGTPKAELTYRKDGKYGRLKRWHPDGRLAYFTEDLSAPNRIETSYMSVGRTPWYLPIASCWYSEKKTLKIVRKVKNDEAQRSEHVLYNHSGEVIDQRGRTVEERIKLSAVEAKALIGHQGEHLAEHIRALREVEDVSWKEVSGSDASLPEGAPEELKVFASLMSGRALSLSSFAGPVFMAPRVAQRTQDPAFEDLASVFLPVAWVGYHGRSPEDGGRRIYAHLFGTKEGNARTFEAESECIEGWELQSGQASLSGELLWQAGHNAPLLCELGARRAAAFAKLKPEAKARGKWAPWQDPQALSYRLRWISALKEDGAEAAVAALAGRSPRADWEAERALLGWPHLSAYWLFVWSVLGAEAELNQAIQAAEASPGAPAIRAMLETISKGRKPLGLEDSACDAFQKAQR